MVLLKSILAWLSSSDSAVLRLHSPSQRKEPVGGENNTLEGKERRKQTVTEPTASLQECLERKDHNVLLAMRDQARLVSTAIQLLTSPESSCLHTSASVCHKVCCSDAAEPDTLDKPQSQVDGEPHASCDFPLLLCLFLFPQQPSGLPAITN